MGLKYVSFLLHDKVYPANQGNTVDNQEYNSKPIYSEESKYRPSNTWTFIHLKNIVK